jgi:glutamate dehydrogenase
LGIQEELGLTGSACTKVVTGGPDGDLGSNEQLMGNERCVAVVDGSGVLYDPVGINRDELLRLARARKMVCNVDKVRPARALVQVWVDCVSRTTATSTEWCVVWCVKQPPPP